MTGQERTGHSVTISLPSLSSLRSRVRLPRVPLGRLGRGRWRIVLVALVLVAAVIDALLVRQASIQDDRQDSRAAALASAQTRLPVMLSYSYRTLDADLAVASGNTTGPFRKEYSQVLTTVVAPNATTKKISTKAEVSAAAVVPGGGDDVTVLLFITQSTTTGEAAKPVVTGSRIEVTMKDTDDGWFVAGITPV